jgi:hypothetical protein
MATKTLTVDAILRKSLDAQATDFALNNLQQWESLYVLILEDYRTLLSTFKTRIYALTGLTPALQPQFNTLIGSIISGVASVELTITNNSPASEDPTSADNLKTWISLYIVAFEDFKTLVGVLKTAITNLTDLTDSLRAQVTNHSNFLTNGLKIIEKRLFEESPSQSLAE